MPKHTLRMNASGTEAKGEYIVEIDHGEEKRGLKRLKFREEEPSIKFAELLGKGKSKARVLSPDGQQIYPYQ